MKHYYDGNKIFNEQVFQENCIAASQTQSFCETNAQNQNSTVERKIHAFISLASAMLFAVMMKISAVIALQFWLCTINYVVDMLNSASNSSGFIRKEIFTNIKENHYFKNFYTFDSPTFALNPAIQKGNKLPAWHPRSIPSVFISKSREYASNVSMVFNPTNNCILPQFHIEHDDDF